MGTEELLDGALVALKARLARVEIGTEVHSEHWTRNYSRGKNEDESMLRLDMELSNPYVNSHDAKVVLDTLFEGFRLDLLDLVQNGDIDHPSDPLIRTLDGAEKRGKSPVSIDFPAACLYSQHNFNKDTTEYTLFLRIRVEWDNGV